MHAVYSSCGLFIKLQRSHTTTAEPNWLHREAEAGSVQCCWRVLAFSAGVEKALQGSKTLNTPRNADASLTGEARQARAVAPTHRYSELDRSELDRSELDRSDREIDIGYRCVMAPRSIVLIGQSDFNGAGRSKHRRNDLAGNALVVGAHSHHSDEVHFECKIFHGGANSPYPNTAAAYLIRWSHEPVPRFICPDIGGQTEG
jgi:hypothetical protein